MMDERRTRAIQMGMIVLWLLLVVDGSNLFSTYTRDFQIRYTADVAVLFWTIAVLALQFWKEQTARLAWTLGCLGYLIHLGAAFQYAHHWSHAKAFEHVEEASGYGEGIFVSYLFTLVWTGDAIWWWLVPRGYADRPRWVRYLIHGFMGFMFFNATVVFESGFIRWAGIFVMLLLVVGWWKSRRTKIDGHRFARSL